MNIVNDKLMAKGVVNAIGTVTTLGGNVLSDEVLTSIREVSGIFVDMEQLTEEAGNYIARKVGAESAYITNGASSAIVLSVAACLIRVKPDLRYKLPKLEGGKKYVLTFKNQVNEFKYLINISGAKIKEIGDRNGVSVVNFENTVRKFADKTAAIVYFALDPLPNNLVIEKVVEIAHSFGIPVIVDAAAELPPKDNLRKYLRSSADVVIFSGGKAIGSFSDTGIMLGTKEIIDIVRGIGPYREEISDSGRRVFLGRVMKVSKEEIVATTVAFDKFLKMDEEAFMGTMDQKCEMMLECLGKNNSLSARVINPPWYFPRPVTIPRVEIDFKNAIDADKIVNKLKNNNPPIYCLSDKGKLYLNPQCLKEGEEKIISEAILRLTERELMGGMN